MNRLFGIRVHTHAKNAAVLKPAATLSNNGSSVLLVDVIG